MKSENRIGAVTKTALLAASFLAAAVAARADDFGPRGDVRDVRFAAGRLLAHSARNARGQLNAIAISDVVVVKNAALLSWQIGDRRGLMGLIRQYDRWWDALEVYELSAACWGPAVTAYPLPGAQWEQDGLHPSPRLLRKFGLPDDVIAAASVHNNDVRNAAAEPQPDASVLAKPSCESEFYQIPKDQPVTSMGGSLQSDRADTSGYEIVLHYTANDAAGAVFHEPYARAPTAAEIIPNPAGYHFTSNAVMYFDLTIDAPKPVTFAPGTTIDIWFPFVLDDSLRYDLTIGFADRSIGPIYAKPFDNVLHYTLPGFTVTPGRTLMAEIDGNWH